MSLAKGGPMRHGPFGAVALLLICVAVAHGQPRPDHPASVPPKAPAAVPDADDQEFKAYLEGRPLLPPPPGATPLPAAPEPVVLPPPPTDDEFRPTQAASAYPFYAWGRSEFLLWTIKKGSQAPPLITTGPSTADNPAVLTDPTTVVLFPTGAVDYHAFEGGRWAVGTWFDPCETSAPKSPACCS